jgi:hypothetical protein
LSLISGFVTHFRFGGKTRTPSSGAIFKSKRRQRVVQEIGEYTIDIKYLNSIIMKIITNLSYYYF